MATKRKKEEKTVKEEEKKANKWATTLLDWYTNFNNQEDKQNLLSMSIFLFFILIDVILIMLLGILLKSIMQYTFGLNYAPYLLLITILVLGVFIMFWIYSFLKKYLFIYSYIIIISLILLIFFINMWWVRLLLYILLVALYPLYIKNWKKPNIILLVITSLILFTLTIGLFSINDIYGASIYNPFSFNYCATSTQSPYTMSYASINGIILADYNLKATFKPELHNISGSISYTLTNGSSIFKEFKGYFMPPRDTTYISLWINANSETNESFMLN